MMMTWRFGSRSIRNRDECHPHLIRLADSALAISPFDFGISDGGRTFEEQQAMVANHASWTMKSRHRFAWPLTVDGRINGRYSAPVSHAFDYFVLINGRARWEFELYQRMWDEVWSPLSKRLGIAIKWGGHWKSQDGPHIQLTWKDYPARYAADAPTHNAAA